MKIIAIAIGRLLAFVGSLLHRGSVTPGSVALRLCPDLGSRFRLPPIVIAITGSSGKGSTSALIAATLRELGLQVAHNQEGANMKSGIISMLLRHSTLTGRIRADAVVAELDERSCKHVFGFLRPQLVVVTNVTRDQPPRQRHTDFILSEIETALSGDEHLIINGDDPLLMGLVLGSNTSAATPRRFTSYAIAPTSGLTFDHQRFDAIDGAYCPICFSRLRYDYYTCESIGAFCCPRGHFEHRQDISAVAIEPGEAPDGSQDVLVLSSGQRIRANTRLLFNVQNTLAAYTALLQLPLSLDQAALAEALSKQQISKKIYSVFEWHGRQVYVLNNKAENASTFNQSMLFAERLATPLVLVVGWKEISRRYETDDLAWLYDVNFELIAGSVTQAICTGIDADSIAVRLKYAGIATDRITVLHAIDRRLSDTLAQTTGAVVAALNFDHVDPFVAELSE